MVEKLFSRDKARGRSDDEEKKLTLCVQLAALCHDLGHGALSHTWEAVTRSWGIQWRVSNVKSDEDSLILKFFSYNILDMIFISIQIN